MEYIAVAIFLMVVIVNQTIEVMIAFVKAIVMEVNLSTYLSQSLSTLGHIHKFQNNPARTYLQTPLPLPEFFPIGNGTDLNREKYAILQTHWH